MKGWGPGAAGALLALRSGCCLYHPFGLQPIFTVVSILLSSLLIERIGKLFNPCSDVVG
jgi:hypothetical protein